MSLKKYFLATALASTTATAALATSPAAAETVTLGFDGESYQIVTAWSEAGYNITTTGYPQPGRGSLESMFIAPGNSYINEELRNVLHTETPWDGVFHIVNENGNLFNFEGFTGIGYWWENPFHLEAIGTKADNSTVTQTFNFVTGNAEDARRYTMNGFTDLKELNLKTTLLTEEGGYVITNQAIDNLTFTTLPAVPEPRDWLLMTAGLAAVGGMARRRRKTETALSL